MKLSFVDIQNFRKLKNCRVVFSDETTVFVGANNSGKTSAMDALTYFLRDRCNKLSVRDFTLSNWNDIELIAKSWIQDKTPNLSSENWHQLLPTLDVWLCVESEEIYRVSHIIPSLDWKGGKLGVRLVFEPKDLKELYKDYKDRSTHARQAKNGRAVKIWPENMRDFLDRDYHDLRKYFTVKAYILDPSKSDTPQSIPEGSEPIENFPFYNILKIDVISAQRGFSDPGSDGNDVDDNRRLSTQLQKYFEKHLDPREHPEASDLDALEAIEAANKAFDKRLAESFSPPVEELERLNYPGFSDPTITIKSKLEPLQGLKHAAAVQFDVPHDNSSPDNPSLSLPEQYNGLGYQNLISMIFSMIRFRDEWMRVGKASVPPSQQDGESIEPLHLVLVEEPEAHLHIQVQQIFAKKAYEVLRNHHKLKDSTVNTTQLVISTHSGHIAYETEFRNLRYFKRESIIDTNSIPCAKVINLSDIFGNDEKDTEKFVARYLKITHYDLLFADATILVEGTAERMLIPGFIRQYYPDLNRSYISLLEIGGSHAHRLRPLIENLKLPTLIITDLDSFDPPSKKAFLPERSKGYETRNQTIQSWVPKLSLLDDVLDADDAIKTKDGYIRVAYQSEISLQYGGGEETAIPYTFEDAIVLSNIDFLKQKQEVTGLLKRLTQELNKKFLNDAHKGMFDALKQSGRKAEMALELLYAEDLSKLQLPEYIREGLEWLNNQIEQRKLNSLSQGDVEGGGEENE